MLSQPFLGKRSESLNPIDVDLCLLKLIAMVDPLKNIVCLGYFFEEDPKEYNRGSQCGFVDYVDILVRFSGLKWNVRINFTRGSHRGGDILRWANLVPLNGQLSFLHQLHSTLYVELLLNSKGEQDEQKVFPCFLQ